MNFNFILKTELVFARGGFDKIPQYCLSCGKKILLVTGDNSLNCSGRLQQLTDTLTAKSMSVNHITAGKEPDTHLVDTLRNDVGQTDCILAAGGGSVMDTAKALSALLTNPGTVTDYLEDLPEGGGKVIKSPALPMIAVPTTAGTGSEVTKNAVIQVEKWGIKRSMRSDSMMPAVAIIDPDLIEGATMEVLASSAFDALSHLLESYVSINASPMTDALAMTGLPAAIDFIRGLATGKPGSKCFDRIALASTLGGICLANARLSAAHGLVSPLCGKTGMPHGQAIACLTPPAMKTTYSLAQQTGNRTVLSKLNDIANLIKPGADIELAADCLESWRQILHLPKPAEYGLTNSMIDQIADSPSGSIRTCPVKMGTEHLREILAAFINPSRL